MRYFDLDLAAQDRETRWSSTQQAAIDKHIGGILYADLFDYASLREHGHHVSSGITEGACKSLVMLRAKRSGQRWRPEVIRAVLTLHSLVLDDRIAPFWNRAVRSTNVLQSLLA